jgi:hypothetical protein
MYEFLRINKSSVTEFSFLPDPTRLHFDQIHNLKDDLIYVASPLTLTLQRTAATQPHRALSHGSRPTEWRSLDPHLLPAHTKSGAEEYPSTLARPPHRRPIHQTLLLRERHQDANSPSRFSERRRRSTNRARKHREQSARGASEGYRQQDIKQ